MVFKKNTIFIEHQKCYLYKIFFKNTKNTLFYTMSDLNNKVIIVTLFAMLFPGQGSQYIGMLSSFFCKNNNFFKDTFDEASDYIHENLLKIIQEGPKNKLNQSKYTQVAILTASVAIYRLWNKKNGQSPSLMSGHSLGEYSALVCANAIKFSDALKIVFLRGQLMQQIIINRPALMQAIIGLNKKKVKTACLIASKKKSIFSKYKFHKSNNHFRRRICCI